MKESEYITVGNIYKLREAAKLLRDVSCTTKETPALIALIVKINAMETAEIDKLKIVGGK